MKVRFILAIFNFFGVTYGSVDQGRLKLSARQVLFNLCKIFIVLLARYANVLISDDVQANYFKGFSQFFKVFIQTVGSIPPGVNSVILITQWSSRRNQVSMVNRMITLRNEMTRLNSLSENKFKKLEKSCWRDAKVMFLALFAMYGVDFLRTLPHASIISFADLVASLWFEMINIFYVLYISMILQFFRFAQQAMNSYATSMKDCAALDKLARVENFKIMQSELCKIKRKFDRASSFSFFLLLFLYAAHIIYEVSTIYLNMR
jgi:hypothetical protein